jgi:hypothetical protein
MLNLVVRRETARLLKDKGSNTDEELLGKGCEKVIGA